MNATFVVDVFAVLVHMKSTYFFKYQIAGLFHSVSMNLILRVSNIRNLRLHVITDKIRWHQFLGSLSKDKYHSVLFHDYADISNKLNHIYHDPWYRHHSVNPSDFEFFCINRWHVINHVINSSKLEDIKYILVTDADLLLFDDVYNFAVSSDSFFSREREGMATGLQIVVPGAFTIWRRHGIEKFSNYLREIYCLNDTLFLQYVTKYGAIIRGKAHFSDMYAQIAYIRVQLERNNMSAPLIMYHQPIQKCPVFANSYDLKSTDRIRIEQMMENGTSRKAVTLIHGEQRQIICGLHFAGVHKKHILSVYNVFIDDIIASVSIQMYSQRP